MIAYAHTKDLYRMFLDSEWWRQFAISARKRAGGRCHCCRTPKCLQVHHLRYPDNWFDTKLDDVQVLCRACHEKAHGIFRAKKKHRKRKNRKQPWKKRSKVRKSLTPYKPAHGFRIKPYHRWVNRGNSSN